MKYSINATADSMIDVKIYLHGKTTVDNSGIYNTCKAIHDNSGFMVLEKQ